MPKVTPVAVDTNVLLDLAKQSEEVVDCLATLRQRLPNLQIIVLPTVIIELTDILELGGPKPLLSIDSHIKDLNPAMLTITLDSCDVGCPLIASPWKIVRHFFH